MEEPSSGTSRTVDIDDASLTKLADQIAAQFLDETKGCAVGSSSSTVEWDTDGWHYTGTNFARQGRSGANAEAHRVERVLLYVLALDAINFCFWPIADDDDIDDSGSSSNKRRKEAKNLLEYEHLAIALRRMAERDDNGFETDGDAAAMDGGGGSGGGGDDCDGTCRADPTYAFSPTNLASLTVESFLDDVRQYLPDAPAEEADDGQAFPDCYCIPNAAERVRLLNELGHGLLAHHGGSATALLRKCRSTDNKNDRPSAVKLVQLITSTFPGFRDEAIDGHGRHVCFYKRAQIAVGDLWAAFGRGQRTDTVGGRLTDFDDIGELTTFADYRVPQLLRHVGVLRYADGLAA